MTRRELLDICLMLPEVYEDYPFRTDDWATVRHNKGQKIFAFIYTRENRLCINLKCEPMRADFLRTAYTDVLPGFHLNHQHWNTVHMDGDVPLDELHSMIHHSHALTQHRTKTG